MRRLERLLGAMEVGDPHKRRWGWWPAYYRDCCRTLVCFPWGIHLLARWAVCVFRPSGCHPWYWEMSIAYQLGYSDGFVEGSNAMVAVFHEAGTLGGSDD
jgi:hypothetical protein